MMNTCMLVSIGVTGCNNTEGGRQNQPWVKVTLIYEGFKLRKIEKLICCCFFLSLHHPNNRFENIFLFIFASLQLRTQKELFLGRKNVGGAFAPTCTPNVTPMLVIVIYL